MAVPVLALIKAIAPYVTQVAAAAIPAFTSKPEAIKSDPMVSKQIEELQTAVTHNAQSIQTLAEKLQQAMHGIEDAAREAKRQAATYKTMLWASLALSIASFVTTILLLIR